MDLNGAFFVKDGTDIGLVVSIEGQKEALYYTKTPISDGKFRLKVSSLRIIPSVSTTNTRHM